MDIDKLNKIHKYTMTFLIGIILGMLIATFILIGRGMFEFQVV